MGRLKCQLGVLCIVAGCVMLLLVNPGSAGAQATPTASSSAASISVGATASYFEADYGKRALSGYAIHADVERTTRWGLEFEARVLRFNQEVGTHQTTFLIGPRYTLKRTHYTPYAKFLTGEGMFHFPYNYGEGSYFVLAPGAGVDVPVGSSRYSIRAIDFEYQSWPGFTYGGLNPYGVSAGISVRIF